MGLRDLPREGLDVHRTGTLDERREWVLLHPAFSSVTVCLVSTALVTVLGLVVRPSAVTLPAVIVLFGATLGVALLLLALVRLRPARPAPRRRG